MERKQRVLITVLVLIIIILAAIVFYSFIIKPSISGYVIDKQAEGYQIAILTIMQRASTCQTVPLFYNNQTINLIAVECLQQGQTEPTGQ